MTPAVPLSLVDLTRTDFRASAAADALNQRLQTELLFDFKYQPARLAIALSLADQRPPTSVDLLGKPIRGETLFSPELAELAIWVGLITEHAGVSVTTRRGLQELVAAHWTRGIEIVARRWSQWQGSPSGFLESLVP